MLMPYNVVLLKYMKEPFIILSLFIPEPRAPSNEIDVYLRSLLDELREIWNISIVTYNLVSKKKLIACDDNVDN